MLLLDSRKTMSLFRFLALAVSSSVWRTPLPTVRAAHEAYEEHYMHRSMKRGHQQRQLQASTIWQQVGSDINDFISSIALSSDGMILAVGNRLAPCPAEIGGSNCGRVRIYERSDSSSGWTQMGQDITGLAASEYAGHDLSISSDGQTLAVGASGVNTSYYWRGGAVRVFIWDGGATQWQQWGGDVTGTEADAYLGHEGTFSLSGDGKRVAVGTRSGLKARIFQMSNATTTWSQMGTDLLSEYPPEKVALSSDGQTVIMSRGGYSTGFIRVFRWYDEDNTWGQLGSSLVPTHEGGNLSSALGMTISISADGNVVALGGPYDDSAGNDAGHVRVFEWTNTEWIQKGSDIYGEKANDVLAMSGLSLSSDGLTLAVTSRSGYYAKVYTWSVSTDSWIQVGTNIWSGNDCEYVSLSADGNTLAILDYSARRVAVFSTNLPTSSGPTQSPSLLPTSVPSSMPSQSVSMLDITVEGQTVRVPLSSQQGYQDEDNNVQDTPGYRIEADPYDPNDTSSIVIIGNQWKALALPGGGVKVDKGTNLEFDFFLFQEVDFHSICLANDLQVQTNKFYCFCMAYTELALESNDGFYTLLHTTQEGSARHYLIQIWKFFTGTFQYLAFVQDNDGADSSLGNSKISNIKFQTVPVNICI